MGRDNKMLHKPPTGRVGACVQADATTIEVSKAHMERLCKNMRTPYAIRHIHIYALCAGRLVQHMNGWQPFTPCILWPQTIMQ